MSPREPLIHDGEEAVTAGHHMTPGDAATVPDHPTADPMPGLILEESAQDLLFRVSRTAHGFTDEPVTDDELARIHDLVRWAPTSMNTQPLRVVALRSRHARQQLLPSMADGNRAKAAHAPLVLVLAAETRFDTLMDRTFPLDEDAGSRFEADDDLREHTAQFNAALQIGYLIVGLRAAGLGAAPMAGFDRAGVDATFFADSTLRTQLIMGVGRVVGPPPFGRLPRLAFDQVFSEL